MTDTTSAPTTNAAGVPLIIPAKSSTTLPGGIDFDYSIVPDGVNGKTYTAEEIAALTAPDAQGVMNALCLKYDGVKCVMDEGTNAIGSESETFWEASDIMGKDWTLVQELEKQGATLEAGQAFVAAQHAPAPAPSPAAVPSPTTTTGTVTLTPGSEIKIEAPSARATSSISSNVTVSVHPSALQQLEAFLRRMEAGVVGDVHTMKADARALLKHFGGK